MEQFRTLLDEAVSDIDISILVNNVGSAPTIPSFGALHLNKIWDSMRQINLCVNSQTFMSQFMLARMIERSKKSAIINVSSAAFNAPSVKMPVFSAASSYTYCLSESLRSSHSDKIDVITVTPGFNPAGGATSHTQAVLNQLGSFGHTHGSALDALKLKVQGPGNPAQKTTPTTTTVTEEAAN